MTDEIKPRIDEDGEPVCSEECSHAKPHAHWACMCHEQAGRMVPHHGACIPGIRQQRDEARTENEDLQHRILDATWNADPLRARIRHQIATTQGAAGEDCRECLRALLAEKE